LISSFPIFVDVAPDDPKSVVPPIEKRNAGVEVPMPEKAVVEVAMRFEATMVWATESCA